MRTGSSFFRVCEISSQCLGVGALKSGLFSVFVTKIRVCSSHAQPLWDLLVPLKAEKDGARRHKLSLHLLSGGKVGMWEMKCMWERKMAYPRGNEHVHGGDSKTTSWGGDEKQVNEGRKNNLSQVEKTKKKKKEEERRRSQRMGRGGRGGRQETLFLFPREKI